MFEGKLLHIAKTTNQRDFRNPYILSWDPTCLFHMSKAQSIPNKQETANKLLEHLSSRCKAEWTETMENIDTKHRSRKAWATINKLTGRKHILSNSDSMNLNAVASCLIKNCKSKQPNREFKRNVNLQLKMEWNSLSADQDLCKDFLTNKVMVAVKTLKFGKASGSDNLNPEFFYTLISEL